LWKQRLSQAWAGAALVRAETLPDLDELIADEVVRQPDVMMTHNILLWASIHEQQFVASKET
jgi:hypothetical protein